MTSDDFLFLRVFSDYGVGEGGYFPEAMLRICPGYRPAGGGEPVAWSAQRHREDATPMHQVRHISPATGPQTAVNRLPGKCRAVGSLRQAAGVGFPTIAYAVNGADKRLLGVQRLQLAT
ncbi:hypothetical protein HV213_10430 [Klebsiella sp. RHBSTW-00484]|uniref:hypothetical protein n=1 Tax=unclassified Klebsiella TaxID=2608929 RepID=UPI0015E54B36|nr:MULTISPECIES: hypothetical protein [unclassified Klebsiella]QLO36222.1 hypothetical protein HV213_10430 [Klebsiella sp. RHBSTW-00484]QLT75739.1 hypothetical protein HV204_10430 [Klebsiella sp. RHBSTW-00464]